MECRLQGLRIRQPTLSPLVQLLYCVLLSFIQASSVPSLWPRHYKKVEEEPLQLSGCFKEKDGGGGGGDHCHRAAAAAGTSPSRIAWNQQLQAEKEGARTLNPEHENKCCSDRLRCLITCLVKMCSLCYPAALALSCRVSALLPLF